MHTSYTIPVVDSKLYRHIWREEVPRLAQHHEFLMHAVLGFAAAHQLATSSISREPQEYSVVRHHYSQALSLFRDVVVNANEESAGALLCFIILSSFLTLYLECVTPAEGTDPMTGLAVFLNIARTSGRVLEQVKPSLRESTVGALMSHTLIREEYTLEPSVEHALSVLDGLCITYLSSAQTSHSSSSGDASLLINALASLRKLFTLRCLTQKSWMHILHWAISLESGFVELLQNDNPIALCTVAYWSVPIFHAPHKWYTGNWAKRMLLTIVQRLRGTQWEIGLAWPLRETIGHDCRM